MQIINQHGTSIYEQQLDDVVIEKSVIDSISTIALGFKNMMDLSLSSVNYGDYCIYFRKGLNFLIVVLTNHGDSVELVINQMMERLLAEDIINQFIEFAKFDLPVQNVEIITAIRRIMVNLSFVNDLSEFKKNLHSSVNRY